MAVLQKVQVGFRYNPVRGQIFAVVMFGIGLCVRFAADAVLPAGYPYVTFFPAIILTTYVAGLWPGITVALLSGIAAWFFFVPPLYSFGLGPGTVLAMAFYAFVATVDIAVIHIMTTALVHLDAERRRSAELSHQSQVMFAELQHRVSNNLQLVSALLMIQQSKVSDPAALKVLEEARSRVATLGRLHRMLHDPGRQDVDLGDYLRELCHDVIDAAGASHVTWEVEAEPVRVSADKLVPLALIVAELVSNSLEHAFPDGRPGKVSVTVATEDGSLRLAVRDSGPGLPTGFDFEAQTSLGLRIVRALVGQLEGRVTMHSDRGAVATLVFPI